MEKADHAENDGRNASPGLTAHESIAEEDTAEADEEKNRADQEQDEGSEEACKLFSARN